MRLVSMQILIVQESVKVGARMSKVCLLLWEHFLVLARSCLHQPVWVSANWMAPR